MDTESQATATQQERSSLESASCVPAYGVRPRVPRPSLYYSLRAGKSLDDWRALTESLAGLQSIHDKYANAFEAVSGCGSAAFVERNASSGRVRVRSQACNHRLCPVCRVAHGKKWRDRVSAAFLHKQTRPPNMVTLTLPHSDRPLSEQIKHLRNAFKSMRQTDDWSDRVTGGYSFLEITRNEETNQWHPHLHLVMWSKFFPCVLLRRLWEEALGVDRAWVWIGPIEDGEKSARYVTKYLTKGADPCVFKSPELLLEYLVETQGIHFARAFGDPPHKKGKAKEKLDDMADRSALNLCLELGRWETVGSFNLLHRGAMAGDAQCLDTLAKLPWWRRWYQEKHSVDPTTYKLLAG